MKLSIIVTTLLVILDYTTSSNTELINSDPKFSAPIANITVPVGREAILTCKVHDLVSYKVAWLRVDTQTILTIQNHVITKNHRIAISHTEHRIWQLKIREVTELDRGWYMCQINTDPMKSQVGYLDVVVPPDIIDYQTSHDMAAEEGQNVTLTCTATGQPQPTIIWRKEKEKPIIMGNENEFNSVEGQNLSLSYVSRHHMGAYLCIASNGVPPTVSKRILLVVNFAPIVWTEFETLYLPFGQKFVLQCISESYPTSVNYWVKETEFIQGGTYESVTLENVYKIVMRLAIRPMKPKDFGEYKCVAKNSLGQTEKIITIHNKSKQKPNSLYDASIIETGNELALQHDESLFNISSGPIAQAVHIFIILILFNIYLFHIIPISL